MAEGQTGYNQPVMATPIQAEGAAYPGTYAQAPPQGQYPGAQPFSGGYQTTGGAQGYAQPQQPQPQAVYGGGYAPQQFAPQQYPQQYPQQIVYVAPPQRVAYGYTYGERARMVYWGSPYARILTLLFIIMVIIGIVLEATSPTGCRHSCSSTTCVDTFGDTYPCTCNGGTTCENEQFAPQGQAGAALISIGVVALIVQSCIACGCCGACCLPPQPVVVQPRGPPMMVAAAQPAYAPPMQQPMQPQPPMQPMQQTGY